eukprot:gene17954-21492_t
MIAQQWLTDTTHGKDSSAERQALRANPTLTDLAKRYMTDYAPRKKIGSRKENQRLWEQHILPTLGSFKVSSLTREDILKLQHSLQHLSTTANRVLSLLSKAFNLAELWGDTDRIILILAVMLKNTQNKSAKDFYLSKKYHALW